MPAPRLHKLEDSANESQLVHYLNLFRILLALFYLGLLFTQHGEKLGIQPTLLWGQAVAAAYLGFAVMVWILCWLRKTWTLTLGKAALVADTLVLTYLAWSVNGIGKGFAVLPIVMLGAIASLFRSPVLILITPAAASAMLWLVPMAYGLDLHGAMHSNLLIHALIYFSVTWLGLRQSNSAKETLTIARQQRRDIISLTQLNEAIIDKMRTGVIVLDNDRQPVHCNRAARRLLNISSIRAVPECLSTASLEQDKFIYTTPEGEKISVYRQTPDESSDISLLFLENSHELAKTAHEMSLKTLGRLSASIAHEIRNPLSAIYTASQLLNESPAIRDEDKALTRIISKQIERSNIIIENVLNLSRQHVASPEKIELKAHLNDFLRQFSEDQKLDPALVELFAPQHLVCVLFDKSHLNQILWNLCKNALKHGKPENGEPKFSLALRDGENGICLDIENPGQPMKPCDQKQLFEPFHTTHSQGTGLGLYLSRELCQSNNAMLTYRYVGRKHRFRIHFDQ